jgi:thiol-disulfide isomerase/thioredoxin
MQPIIYFFSSPTCAPCKIIKPIIMDLQEDYHRFRWLFVDTTNDPEQLAAKMQVNYVPTMVAVDTITGREIGRHSGSTAMGYYHVLKNASYNG